MPDTFLLTIIFIFLTTIVAAFVRGKSKDRCLADFANNLITLETKDGKDIWGKLNIESTGIELKYEDKHKDEDGHDEYSYILYKNEFARIQLIVRYHDHLDEKSKKEREKELKKTYHPGFSRRAKRKIRNFFSTVRDSILEVVNLFIGQAKKMSPAQGALSSQDKYVSQMKDKIVGLAATAYEPLLEKHIGRRVVLELIKGDKAIERVGVLKDYTQDFIEIMDVNYSKDSNQPPKIADIIAPRTLGAVRHLAE